MKLMINTSLHGLDGARFNCRLFLELAWLDCNFVMSFDFWSDLCELELWVFVMAQILRRNGFESPRKIYLLFSIFFILIFFHFQFIFNFQKNLLKKYNVKTVLNRLTIIFYEGHVSLTIGREYTQLSNWLVFRVSIF
jgi:hypothetical protein